MVKNEAAEPVAQIVKRETTPNHIALEDLLAPKLQQLSSRTGYAAILKTFYGFFQPMEKSTNPFISIQQLPDYLERRKAENILLDLKALGEASDSLPLCTQIPVITNVAEAFGALYVLEGSTLGGQGITRMLLKNPLLQLNENEVRFFKGYGVDTGKKWIAFQQAFNNIATDNASVRQVVTTANETFAFFKTWIEQTLY